MTGETRKSRMIILLSVLLFLLPMLMVFTPTEATEIKNPPDFPDLAETAGGTENSQNQNQPSGKYIALTFDDGPHRGTTDKLLDGLRERGIRATFFLVGEEAASNRELVLRMKADGHQVGNHTWGHSRLEYLSDEQIVQEIGKTDALLQSLLGPGSYWLRPPYGFIRAGTEDLIPVPMIAWSVDTRDWESRDTEKIVQAALDAVEPGSIILLHDIYQTSVDAALRLADELPRQGYELVTVEELLSLYGVEPKAGVKYRSGKG